MTSVSKHEVAAAIARAANQMANGAAPETVLLDLAQWLAPDEAIGLMRLVRTPRMRCDRCNNCVSLARASGDHCLGCARAVRKENESTQGEQHGR